MNWTRQAGVYLLLAAVCLCAVYSQGTISVDVLSSSLAPEHVPRSPFVMEELGDRILTPLAEARAAGIRAGDRLVSMDGAAYTGLWTIGGALRTHRPGQGVPLEIQPAGSSGPETVQRTVVLRPRYPRPDIREVIRAWCLWLPFPFFCLLFAVLVVSLRPQRAVSWVAMLVLLSLGQVARWPFVRMASPSGEFALWYHSLAHYSMPVWLLLMALLFPVPFPWLRRRTWLAAVAAVPLLWFALLRAVVEVGKYTDFTMAQTAAQLLLGPPAWFPVVRAAAVVFAGIVLVAKAVRLRHSGASSKIAVLVVAVGIAFGPLAIFVIAETPLAKNGYGAWTAPLLVPALLGWYVLPPAIAWTVISDRFRPFRSSVRAFIDLLFSPLSVFFVRIAFLAIAVLQPVLAIFFPRRWPLYAGVFTVCVAGVLFAARAGEALSDWIDNLLFHDLRRAEDVLFPTHDELKGLTDVAAKASGLARALAEAFDTQLAVVLLEAVDGVFRPRGSLGLNEESDWGFREKSGVVQSLAQTRKPLPLTGSVAGLEVVAEGERATEDWKRLDAAGVKLLLPLVFGQALIGFIALGRKVRGKAYSQDEVQLAQELCDDVAESFAHLIPSEREAELRAAKQRRRREEEETGRLLAELAPASGVATRRYEFLTLYLPADPPGGAFCHFQRWPDQRLGFFLGEVAGVGLDALGRAAQWKRALWEALASGKGALAARLAPLEQPAGPLAQAGPCRWLCAEYNPDAGRLDAVNRGMAPPCLLRFNDQGGEVLRLAGEDPSASSPAGSLSFAGGDVLVAFSDRVVRAADDRVWSEAAMLDTLMHQRSRPVAKMLSCLRDGLLAAGSSRPTEDDIVVCLLSCRAAASWPETATIPY